jgi:hypothetical protein
MRVSFFLSQLNAHNTLNTYIYHLLPPTCFGVVYIEEVIGDKYMHFTYYMHLVGINRRN